MIVTLKILWPRILQINVEECLYKHRGMRERLGEKESGRIFQAKDIF